MTRHAMHRGFIVGSPRTGTTLLQSLLGAHSEIATFTESHFFSRFRRDGTYEISSDLPERMACFLEENSLPNVRLDVPTTGRVSEQQARTTARKCIKLLDRCARARKRSSWIEKTPLHLRAIPIIEAAAPDAWFVHIIRDPRDTITSLWTASKAWSPHRTPDWRRLAGRLAIDLRITINRAQQDRIVSYEGLTANPQQICQTLVEDFGLDSDNYSIERYKEVAAEVVLSTEHWKSRNQDAIEASTHEQLDDEAKRALDAFSALDLYAEARSLALA